MTFQQLNYLVEISKCGSINKAAQKLYLSQSGISIAIRELEEELNIKLFLRTNKGVSFTPEGREFLSHAVSLLESKKRLELMYSKNQLSAANTYLSISTQRFPFTEAAFIKLLDAHNGEPYKLKLMETGIEDVIGDVASHGADIGVVSKSDFTERTISRLMESRETEFYELCSIKPCVYLRKGHPLSGRKSVEEKDLIPYPYITFEQNQGVAIDFSEECQIFTEEIPSRRIVINTRESAIDIVAHTDAVTTGSGLLARGISSDNIMCIPLDNYPDIRIGYMLPADSKLSRLSEEFIGYLKQSIDESVEYTASLIEH